MSFERDRVELADYARTVWKRKWLIIVPTILVFASALVALRFMTPIYISSAILEIKEKDDIDTMVSGVLEERQVRERREKGWEREALKKIRQDMTGERFLESVGIRLGLDQDERILAAAQARQERMPNRSLDELVVQVYTSRISGKITMANAGIDRYQITAEDADPRAAYDIVNALVEEYDDFVLNRGSETSNRTSGFAREQLDEKLEELEVAEQALRDHQASISMGLIRDANPINEGNLGEARIQTDKAKVEVARLESRIARGLERLDNYSSAAALKRQASSPRLDRLAGDLARAEREEVPLLIQGTSAQAGVSRIRQDIFNEMRTRVASAFPDEDTRTQNQIGDVIFDYIVLGTVQSRKGEIQRLIADYGNRGVRSTRDDLDLEKLEARVNDLRSIVSNLEETLSDTEFKDKALERALEKKVSTIKHAEVPQRPDRPNRMRILLLALAAGPLLGFGAIVLTEYLDTSLKTVEEVEEVLGLPVLGTVPKLVPANTQSHNRRRRAKRHVGAAGMVLLMALGGGAFDQPAQGPAPEGTQPGTRAAGEIHGKA